MLDSKESKIIATLAGGYLLAKYFSPKFGQFFGQKCCICGAHVPLHRRLFTWSKKPG